MHRLRLARNMSHWHIILMLRHWSSASSEQDPNWMVLQKAGNCWDCYLRLWVHCGLHMCWPSDWSLHQSLLPWGPNPW
jgi:hypothetical protein